MCLAGNVCCLHCRADGHQHLGAIGAKRLKVVCCAVLASLLGRSSSETAHADDALFGVLGIPAVCLKLPHKERAATCTAVSIDRHALAKLACVHAWRRLDESKHDNSGIARHAQGS